MLLKTWETQFVNEMKSIEWPKQIKLLQNIAFSFLENYLAHPRN